MTENKHFEYHELKNGQYGIYNPNTVDLYGNDAKFLNRICNVDSKKEAEKVCNILNELNDENKQLKDENESLKKQIYFLKNEVCDLEMQLEDLE